MWFALWIFGAPQHAVYFAKCGGRLPVQHTSSMMPGLAAGHDNGYLLPTDFRYYNPPYLWTTAFYCTEQQALDDGVWPDGVSDSYGYKTPARK